MRRVDNLMHTVPNDDIRTGLLLAAHGSTPGSALPRQMSPHVERIRSRGLFDYVDDLYYKEPPYFSEAFDRLPPDEPWSLTVIPMFTSDGYYADHILSRELGLCGSLTRRGSWEIRLAPAIGTHSGVGLLLADSARQAIDQAAFDPSATSVVLVGHGTARHPASGATTLAHAESIRQILPEVEVIAVFLDQPPFIESAAHRCTRRHVVIVPNFIGGSHHVHEDIPRRLGLQPRHHIAQSWSCGRTACITAPIFGDPSVTELILDSVRSTLRGEEVRIGESRQTIGAES